MKIGIDAGHTLSGRGTGASGFASETQKNREVFKRLVQMLKEKGHTIYNCTVDKSNNDLGDRVALANRQAIDVFLSIHLNAFKQTTSEMGVETYYCAGSSKGQKYASAIQSELVKDIKWKNRGVKTANYYVLKNTKAPAVLVELGFCDSKADMNKWNTEKICKAIFKGLTGVSYSSSTPAPTPKPPTTSNKKLWELCISGELVKELQRAIGVKADGYFGDDTLKKCPLLKLNSKGAAVKVLQKRLVQLGHSTNGVDGIFGNGTKNAVIAFQKKKGLSADGIVGQATWKALMLK